MRKIVLACVLGSAVTGGACSDDGELGANGSNGSTGQTQTDSLDGSGNLPATSPADDGDGSAGDALDTTTVGSGGSTPTSADDTGTTTLATSTGSDTGTDSASTTEDATSTTSGDPQEPYDACAMMQPICLQDEICLLTPMGNVCTPIGCDTPDDCPAVPPGGTAMVICQDGNNNGIDDCLISCSDDATCPTDMICFNNQICVWPPQ
jgi:hypothetical protein